MGIRHEELLGYIEEGKNGCQLVFKSQFGGFGDSLRLLRFGAGALGVNAGGAGLKLW